MRDTCDLDRLRIRLGRAPLVSSCPDYPFERIALDIMAAQPTTESNRYIPVVGDYFTKWKEAFPIAHQEAKTVAEKSVNEVISERIHSDQGGNVEAQLFQEMCLLFELDYTQTNSYHTESDGMIERMNCSLQDMFTKVCVRPPT